MLIFTLDTRPAKDYLDNMKKERTAIKVIPAKTTYVLTQAELVQAIHNFLVDQGMPVPDGASTLSFGNRHEDSAITMIILETIPEKFAEPEATDA